MGDDELHRRLESWLDDSGRALELRTAREFRVHSRVRWVDQACHYEDISTSKHREGDVLAVYHWIDEKISAALEVAVECKAGRSNPWVAFYDDRRHVPKRPDSWFWCVGNWPHDYKQALVDEWRALKELSTDRVATHAVSAFGKEGNNHAGDAAKQALSFAQARIAGGTTRFSGDDETLNHVNAVIPVVVTEAPMFTCEVRRDGSIDLQPVDRFDLWVHVKKYDRRRIYVRSPFALKRMSEDLERLAVGPGQQSAGP